MTDETPAEEPHGLNCTENVTNETATAESADYLDSFSSTHGLIAVSVTIGLWTLLGVTAGWGEPQSPVGVTPTGAITATLIVTVLATAVGIERRPFPFYNSRDKVWDVLIFWCVMIFGSGTLTVVM